MEDSIQKLAELLIACNITWCPKAVAEILLAAGVTLNPYSLHCYQCKHFIGAGDFGLCCDLKYDLCYKYTNACAEFEKKENNI